MKEGDPVSKAPEAQKENPAGEPAGIDEAAYEVACDERSYGDPYDGD